MPIEALGDHRSCQWISQAHALLHFASYVGATQSQQHIKPLHWAAACRLVLEGGFFPDDVTPRPPFIATKRKDEWHLSFDPASGRGGEATVLGGLKTKNVDVVAAKSGIGPVLAVSCKGMTGAFRNLTNRMEETIGECTNIHITYPAMVFGYMFAIRANKAIEQAVSETKGETSPPVRQLLANDVAIQKGGEPVESIIRFHAALRELTGRRGIRNDVSRYEAIALGLVEMADAQQGRLSTDFPLVDSPLRFETFFQSLYLRYDERYVFAAPDMKTITQRVEWSRHSPVFESDYLARIDYTPRLNA